MNRFIGRSIIRISTMLNYSNHFTSWYEILTKEKALFHLHDLHSLTTVSGGSIGALQISLSLDSPISISSRTITSLGSPPPTTTLPSPPPSQVQNEVEKPHFSRHITPNTSNAEEEEEALLEEELSLEGEEVSQGAGLFSSMIDAIPFISKGNWDRRMLFFGSLIQTIETLFLILISPLMGDTTFFIIKK